MRNNLLLTSFLSLLIAGVLLLPSVVAEGNGEVNRTSNNSLYMSYDTEIRQISSEYAFNEQGIPIYFRETDTDLSVNFTIVDDMIYLTVKRNPSRTDPIDRHDIYVCTQEYVRELRRFSIVNDGTKCNSWLYAHYLGQIREDYTYEFRVPKSLNNELIPLQWFIGNGAGGGLGCSCDPAVYNVFPLVNSVEASYLVNTNDNIGLLIQYIPLSSFGCVGDILSLERRYNGGSWVSVDSGSSSDFGTLTTDCNGLACRVAEPQNNVQYYKNVDMQQVNNDVDFRAKLICTGSSWDGYTYNIAQSSIYNENPNIDTNFTNNSVFTDSVNFYFNASDSSPHLNYIDLYITNNLNETYTTSLAYAGSHEFTKNFAPGTYTMYGRARDYFGLANYTEVYYFTIEAGESEGIIWFMFGGLLILFSYIAIRSKEKRDGERRNV